MPGHSVTKAELPAVSSNATEGLEALLVDTAAIYDLGTSMNSFSERTEHARLLLQ